MLIMADLQLCKKYLLCNAHHGRFLHLCWPIVNIKGGSLLVESVLFISDSSQDEPNHPCCCFPWQRCVSSFSFIVSQNWVGCFTLCEEVVRKPKMFLVSTCATSSTLLRWQWLLLHFLSNHCHLHREEEENHLLGWDGTRRSSSAVHLQERGWRRIRARRGELKCEREEGGKVPPLLDHHHLHLHLHLLHNHLHCVKCTMHTGWSRPLLIDLNLSISSIIWYELFVWLIWLCYFLFPYMCYR